MVKKKIEKIALIVGVTGLVGMKLLDRMTKDDYYTKIVIITRKKLPKIESSRLQSIILKDFDQLDSVASQIDPHDVYCTLGSTMKKAKTKKNFYKIDVEYPLKIAEIVKNKPNFQQFLIVTSYGANSQSKIFYNRTKGEVEEKLKNCNLPSLKILRPPLIIGKRNEVRIREKIAQYLCQFLSLFLIGNRILYLSGKEIAKAMIRVAKKRPTENLILGPRKIKILGR